MTVMKMAGRYRRVAYLMGCQQTFAFLYHIYRPEVSLQTLSLNLRDPDYLRRPFPIDI